MESLSYKPYRMITPLIVDNAMHQIPANLINISFIIAYNQNGVLMSECCVKLEGKWNAGSVKNFLCQPSEVAGWSRLRVQGVVHDRSSPDDGEVGDFPETVIALEGNVPPIESRLPISMQGNLSGLRVVKGKVPVAHLRI
ncbi:hypothetical protein CDAR_376881 [Caerostris darwini]|uniref:Galectin n=1 Tax=Caerostris darwini TaxID=1538125 RepID=A0AAV4SS05_9ARAC|nr:hypothetical protein CDAR_376881 [Caerostris darwini]